MGEEAIRVDKMNTIRLIRIIYIILILIIGTAMFWFQENIEIPNAEKAWDECNNIEDKEGYGYFKCLERYDINRKEVRSKDYMTTMILLENVFMFLFISGIIIFIAEVVVWLAKDM